MYKNIFFAIVLSMFISVAFVQTIQAQSEDKPRTDLIGQFTVIKSNGESSKGFGLGISRYFSNFIASDSSYYYFPGDTGKAFQMLSGFKVGYRSEKFGLFGKFRPGMSYTSIKGMPGVEDTSKISYAMDYGGVVEVYPTRRIGVRVDLGNLMLKNLFDSGTGEIGGGKFNSNFQVATGIMLRF